MYTYSWIRGKRIWVTAITDEHIFTKSMARPQDTENCRTVDYFTNLVKTGKLVLVQSESPMP